MTLRHTMELAGARVALAVIPRLPRPAVMGLARGAGWLAYRLCRHLRKVGQANLDLAYGASLTPAEKTGILKQAFVNFALVMLDVFWFARDAAARLEKYVHFHPSYYEHLFQDKAYVCIAAHIGNWEILGKAVSQHGYPTTGSWTICSRASA
jgi:lauroyl/myristoyl acyltransferase